MLDLLSVGGVTGRVTSRPRRGQRRREAVRQRPTRTAATQIVDARLPLILLLLRMLRMLMLRMLRMLRMLLVADERKLGSVSSLLCSLLPATATTARHTVAQNRRIVVGVPARVSLSALVLDKIVADRQLPGVCIRIPTRRHGRRRRPRRRPMLEGDTRRKIVQIVRKPAQHSPRTRPLEEIKADALLLRVDVNDVSHVVAELATRPTPAMALGKVKADLLLRNQLRWSLLVLLVSVLLLALVVRWRTDAWRPAVRVRVRGLLRRRRRRGRRRGILLLSEQGGPRRACRLLAADDGHGLMMIGLDSLLAEGMNLRWKTSSG